jgi:lysophospholipase L1-like esterase
VHYFDVVGGAVTVVIAARVLSLALTPGWRWNTTALFVVGLFLITLLALTVFRSRAYRQTRPWLVLSFAVAAALTLAVLFWPLHVILFATVMAAGCSALAVALIMRTRRISEPVSRYDVFKLGALAISVLAAVAAAEVGLRLAPDIVGEELRQSVVVDPRQMGVPHAYIGHLHRPNSRTIISGKDFRAVHEVDAKGFRNSRPWPEKADIVVVGDSVTFGYGAARNQAWPAIIGDDLPRVPLINLALIGAGPQQYLRVYETFGLELRPKLLLAGVFAGNDFWDAETFDLWLRSGAGGNFIVWREFGRPGPVKASLSDPKGSLRTLFDWYAYPALRSSRVFNLLRALYSDLGGGLSTPPVFYHFKDGGRVRLSPGDFRRKQEIAARNSRAFGLALNAFENMHSVAERNGTHVLMVLQPSKEEVYLPLLEDDVPDLTRALRDTFDDRGIDYLDLTPAFRKRAAAGERLFFENDGHPNASGYALTAQLVLSHLMEHGREYGFEGMALVPTRAASGGPVPRSSVSRQR